MLVKLQVDAKPVQRSYLKFDLSSVWDVPMGTTSGGNFLSDLANATFPPSRSSRRTSATTRTTARSRRATRGSSRGSRILSSTNYIAGDTVVFLAWDEDDSLPAAEDAEQPLGITTFLGHAGDAGTTGMVTAFNLC